MKFLALLLEIMILSFGIYIYLFSTGRLTVKDEEKNKKAEEFRKENGSWMKWMSLLLIAVMTFEVILNIKSFF